MPETITYKTVMERIESSAKEHTPDFPKESTYESWESFKEECESLIDEASEKAWQEVSYWDWAIYTYQGFQVYDLLNSSDRSDAEQLFEDVGGYETAQDQRQGPYEIGCTMAFHWLVSQLTQEIERQAEDLIELAENKLEQLESE